MGDLEEQLARWRGAGLLTPSQAEAIKSYEKLRAPEEPAPAASATAGAPPPPPLAEGPPRQAGRRQTGRSFRFSLPELDARVLGGLLAVLALLALVGAMFALATDVVVAPSHRWSADIEDVAHTVAAALGLTGGLRMAGGRRDGRQLVLVSLALNLLATVLFSAPHLLEAMTLVPVLAWLLLGWLTWSSRFRESAVATPSQVS